MGIKFYPRFLGPLCVGVFAVTGAFAATSGRIEVTGTIAQTCSLNVPTAAVEIQDLQQEASHVINFAFSCNAPFSYSLDSENGALKVDRRIKTYGNFSTSVAYQIDVNLPSDGGAAISQTLKSGEIGPGGSKPVFANSAGGTGLNKTGSLRLSWSPPASPLVAGAYWDRLTLTIDASAP